MTPSASTSSSATPRAVVSDAYRHGTRAATTYPPCCLVVADMEPATQLFPIGLLLRRELATRVARLKTDIARRHPHRVDTLKRLTAASPARS